MQQCKTASNCSAVRGLALHQLHCTKPLSQRAEWFGPVGCPACTDGNHDEIVRELLRSGADINLRGKALWRLSDYQPLFVTIRKTRLEIARALIEGGADINGDGKRVGERRWEITIPVALAAN